MRRGQSLSSIRRRSLQWKKNYWRRCLLFDRASSRLSLEEKDLSAREFVRVYYEPGDARGCRSWGLRASPSLAHPTLPRYPRAAEASEEDESRTCIKGSPERNFLGVAVGVGHPGAGRVPSSASHLAAGSESGCLVGGVLRRRPSKAIRGRVVVGACVLQVGASCPLRSLLVCSRTSSTRVRSFLFSVSGFDFDDSPGKRL